MIEAKKVFETFQKHIGNSIVHVQGTSGYHWNDITQNPNRDINFDDAMGQSTSAVFGLALGLKSEKVVHFDTEGALLMNLGVLASIAGKQPNNFVHFLLDNGCYATTGGQPVPNGEDINYAQMASAAGYQSTYNFSDLEELTTSMEEIMNTLRLSNHSEKPRVIIADTIKGKGVSFMEGQTSWHGVSPSESDYLKALKELE